MPTCRVVVARVRARDVAHGDPRDVRGNTVLVVGGGNTGYQIAKELAATRTAHLAVGSRQKPLPQRILGRDLFSWLTAFGLLDKTGDSRLGKKLRDRNTLIGSSPRELRRHGIIERPRITGATDATVQFADGSSVDADTIIWATGYRSDYSWLALPVLDETGRVRHRRGVTSVPGLYFLGLSWQHIRRSGLLGWVKDDAEFISAEIENNAPGATPIALTTSNLEPAAPETTALPQGAGPRRASRAAARPSRSRLISRPAPASSHGRGELRPPSPR
jgi:putative flavoprotein involved in K+ transport